MGSRPLVALFAAGFVLIAGAVALIFVVGLANGPRSHVEGPTVAYSAPAKPEPPPPIAPPPPLSFVDAENEKRLAPAEAALADIRAAIQKADITGARTQCKTAAKNVSLLAPEPHPRVRAVVDGTRRACECDLLVAALTKALDAIAKAPATKKSACKDAVKLVDELRANKYGDDPSVQTILARFGASCAT